MLARGGSLRRGALSAVVPALKGRRSVRCRLLLARGGSVSLGAGAVRRAVSGQLEAGRPHPVADGARPCVMAVGADEHRGALGRDVLGAGHGKPLVDLVGWTAMVPKMQCSSMWLFMLGEGDDQVSVGR